jgi:hypothetical protein
LLGCNHSEQHRQKFLLSWNLYSGEERVAINIIKNSVLHVMNLRGKVQQERKIEGGDVIVFATLGGSVQGRTLKQ